MLLLGLASTTALLGQVDAREIIRNAVAADERNWRSPGTTRSCNGSNSGVWTPRGG